MDIEKIAVLLDGREYSFSVEAMKDEEEDTVYYRVTPDQGEKILDDISPGYLEFDEHGVLQVDEQGLSDQAKNVAAEIWEAVQEALEPGPGFRINTQKKKS